MSCSLSSGLMLDDVLRLLPDGSGCAYHPFICAGSKGYCALKEMLKNGVAGNTILLESHDLRAMNALSPNGTKGSHSGDVYFRMQSTIKRVGCDTNDLYNLEAIEDPHSTDHLTVLSNVSRLPYGFMSCCTSLATLDLSHLSHLVELPESFLWGCTGLSRLDLSPFSKLIRLPMGVS